MRGRYLAPSLAGEGEVDYEFLPSVLRRLLEDVLAANAEFVVDVGPVVTVLDAAMRPTNQCHQVCVPFEARAVFADVLFVHTDAGGHASRAQRERVHPIRDRLLASESTPEVVGVVPAREIEAWMLADPRAIERVLGFKSGCVQPNEPPRRVHRILDPKSELRTMMSGFDPASGLRVVRHPPRRLHGFLAALADEVDLAELRRVPSFKTLESDLVDALRRREYLL